MLALLVAACASWFARPAAPEAKDHRAEPVVLGATNPHTPIDFTLVLRLPGQAHLTRFLNELTDPAAPGYRHFIDAAAFGERFGVSRSVLSQASAQLARDGVEVTASYPQRTALDVRATAGTIDRVFHVRLMNWRSPGRQVFHAPLGAATVPADLTRAVSAVAGLDGTAFVTDDSAAIQGLTPASARSVYGVDPLLAQRDTGQGESVAVVEFAQFDQSDLDGFNQQFNLPDVAPRNVAVDGGATDNDPSSVAEANLDLEVVHEIAPGAEMLDYNAPQATSSGADTFGAVIDRITADGQARMVSDSWGSCEADTPRADIQRDEQALEAAAARGISVFVAAGDTGAYTCQEAADSNHSLSVSWPSSSPFAVSVGGSSLSVTTTGAYAGETAWDGTLEQAGGGGGLSLDYKRPTWQDGPGVANQFSTGMRQLPDVAAAADPWSGWDTYTGGAMTVAGGTSAATPFWAASMALVAEYAGRHGTGQLGFVDPMLYALAARPQQAPAFHDITVGANRYYPASRGWDFATGLGSPEVANLARDVVAYLKR
ncbi:MAG TPA: S53 family peptidase [Solirubrobacteraceae bacterium]|nr:S53 family peptidase [Solirubrobacteraceae bacterium]